jgi:hypothetical protein
LTVPEPVRELPLDVVSHAALLVALHVQLLPVVTVKLPLVAVAATDAVVGLTV